MACTCSACPALLLLVAIHQSSMYLVHVLPILFKERCKVFLHCSLEECRCIAHPKVHDIRDVRPIVCLDCCFVFVFIGKPYIVIALPYVKFRKEHLALQSLHCCSDPWHRIMISDSLSIHSSVVNNDPFLATVFLANEEDGGDILHCSFSDVAQCLFLFNPCFFNFSFCFRPWIWFAFY
jgi:hypothetical protein